MPPPGPIAEAVALFEQGMRALQQHHHGEAAEAFRGLASRFPREQALLDRSRVYLSLCERELAHRPAGPTSVEERITEATAALNNGDLASAERLAGGVVSEQPDHDAAWYLLAVVEARRGASDSALEHLSRAIDYSPEVRAQARLDADFADLRDLDAFRSLLESPAADESDPGRQARRGRAGR